MKNFLKKNWTLILVIFYVIVPDLIPGPLDDMTLLFAELARRGIVFLIRKMRKG